MLSILINVLLKKTTGKPYIQTAFRDMAIVEIRKVVSSLGLTI